MRERIQEGGLAQYEELIMASVRPAIGFSLGSEPSQASLPVSKLGGDAWVPADFTWPTRKGRPLDFLLQVDLAHIAQFPGAEALPDGGILSFFYDVAEQPWGGDPEDLDGSRVFHFEEVAALERRPNPNADLALEERPLIFFPAETIPDPWSWDGSRLRDAAGLSDDEEDAYFELSRMVRPADGPADEGGNHHLLGHSQNIQDDMQLEAQFVTNGLAYGAGQKHPRRESLEAGVGDWMLLLQLDSDLHAGFMWGDAGMLYYWIRRQDLAQGNFDNVWMLMQCY